jgi:hypothetical protein
MYNVLYCTQPEHLREFDPILLKYVLYYEILAGKEHVGFQDFGFLFQK